MNIKVFQDALTNVDNKYIEEAAVYAACGESDTAYLQSSASSTFQSDRHAGTRKKHPGLWKGLVIAACCIIAVSTTVNIASGISHMGCGGASGAAKDSAYEKTFDVSEAIPEAADEAPASGEISSSGEISGSSEISGGSAADGAAPEDIALGGNTSDGAAAYGNDEVITEEEVAENEKAIAEGTKAIEEDSQADYAYSLSAKGGFFSWLTESWTHILLIPGIIAAAFLIVFLIVRAIMLRKRH